MLFFNVKSIQIMAFHANTNLFFKYDSLQPSHFPFLQETHEPSLGRQTYQKKNVVLVSNMTEDLQDFGGLLRFFLTELTLLRKEKGAERWNFSTYFLFLTLLRFSFSNNLALAASSLFLFLSCIFNTNT